MKKVIIIYRKKLRFCSMAYNWISLSKHFLDLFKILENSNNTFKQNVVFLIDNLQEKLVFNVI